MALEYTDLLISSLQAEKIASELFGIDGRAEYLPGEIDLNFKLTDDHKRIFVLKISRPDSPYDFLDYQQKLLKHLEATKAGIEHPMAMADLKGDLVSSTRDGSNRKRFVRLLTWVPGRIYSSLNPQTDGLRYSLGQTCGTVSSALKSFEHQSAKRNLQWDLAQWKWTLSHLHLFSGEKKATIQYFQNLFESKEEDYKKLRKSIIHNDANDNNIIVSENLLSPKVKTLIDFGDAIYSQVINDVAVASAYAVFGLEDPLQGVLPVLKGYHEMYPLEPEELEVLYLCLGIRLVISATKSALNKIDEPDNTYLQISDTSVWELLNKWKEVNNKLALFSFRHTCGYQGHPNEAVFLQWSQGQTFRISELFPESGADDITPIDLSVGSTWLGLKEDFADFSHFDFKIDQKQKLEPNKVIAGGYLEARSVYGTSSYDKIGNSGAESRTIHLGVDFWLPAQTPVHALLDGEVITAVNDAGDKEYGGLIILKHRVDQLCFYTLYGHLSVESATSHKKGDRIFKGERIGVLGNYPENGNWPPHLHFQIMLSMLDYDIDFPGVAYFSQIEVFKSICPDPNLLFKLKALKPAKFDQEIELIQFRSDHLGKGLSLSYDTPLHMVRGSGVYLFDSTGRKFLDTVNNVAHVGHEHYKVVRAGQSQMAVLNTNTRYLHSNLQELTEELIKTLPQELSVFHYVNSGSEANELALRMIRTASGQKDILASEVGYHGNSNACIEISSYKFDGKGGQGCPEHTHIFPLPDAFRGKYRGVDSGKDYADEVKNQIDSVEVLGRKIAGFIIEPIISCGGQVELPEGFLKSAYEFVRNAGGYCISDEVQVGCGRMGNTFWGFEQHGVIPDVVTIGKPLGNGHPIAAVVCTPDLAERFSNGMEFFNTFGGNPVSCSIGTAVLRTVREERLQQNALETGEYLKNELGLLSKKYPILGDVRGQGLFLGIELVDVNLNPEAEKASYLVNRMKAHGILMSIDGPDHNVLKIKPPLVFSKDNALELIQMLERILNEDYMMPE